MQATNTEARRAFLASLGTDDLVKQYEHYSQQMVTTHTSLLTWRNALPRARGSKRRQVEAEITRLERQMWTLENQTNQYGSEMNRRGLL